MEKLNMYYTVEKELEDVGGIEETTGHKEVNVYTVEHGEVKKFFDLELLNEDNTKECIKDWLDDNGYEEKNINLIQL